MVKLVLDGVNKVERGLLNYSPVPISPIKPSLYGVYVISFFAVSWPIISVLIQNHAFPLEAIGIW